MNKCCCMDLESLRDQFDFSSKETEKGVQIEISAKDPSKTDSLKALIKACHDFCGCC